MAGLSADEARTFLASIGARFEGWE